MKNLLKILFCAIIVDFFYYSSVFTFTGGVNTKLILGVLGLVAFVYNGIKSRTLTLNRELLILTILAACVSGASLFSMVFNNTDDDAYLTYVISMLVWLSAGYMVLETLKVAFGKISVELFADFVIVLSVVQCTFAILGNMYLPVNNFIKMLYPGTGWLDSVERMYGIGDTTALDTGGIRYSIACIFCAHLLVKTGDKRRKLIPWYLFAYVYITIIGNMIARTTTVGAVLGLVYLIFYIGVGAEISFSKLRLLGWAVAVFSIMTIIASWLYATNPIIHDNLRFGFEGFFSLFESGEWEVNSNNTLRSMYVFPDNLKTWMIGDGYFNNPSGDLNYLGKITQGYYMNTDVGYLRFIFYFGLLGLSFFSLMILYAGIIGGKNFPAHRLMIFFFVLLHFIIWLKVSTDCFFILGVFIAMGYILEHECEERPDPDPDLEA